MTASSTPRWSSSADDLVREDAHAVAPHVRRPVRQPVAEQVERDDPVAALRERARQRLVHALAQQQTVQQHGRARALAVHSIGQFAILAAEPAGFLAHAHRPHITGLRGAGPG